MSQAYSKQAFSFSNQQNKDGTLLKSSLTYDELKDEQKKIQHLAKQLIEDDSISVTQFGVEIQQDISEFSSGLLEQVRNRDTEYIGESVTRLIEKVKSMDVQKLTDQGRAKSRLPLVGKWFDQVKKIRSQYEKLEDQLETIQNQLDHAYVMLQKDIEMLDILMQKNHQYFKSLDTHIAAIQLRMKQWHQRELPEWKARLEKSNEAADSQKWQDLHHFTVRLEKKLDDFKRARFLSQAQAPRIRLLQEGDRILMEKIQSVTYHLIPLWKMELVTAIAQLRSSKALRLQREVRETVEESMRRNVEQMRMIHTEIDRESEAGIVSTETLKYVHEQLLATLDETKAALANGRSQRQTASEEMEKMEQELTNSIKRIALYSEDSTPSSKDARNEQS